LHCLVFLAHDLSRQTARLAKQNPRCYRLGPRPSFLEEYCPNPHIAGAVNFRIGSGWCDALTNVGNACRERREHECREWTKMKIEILGDADAVANTAAALISAEAHEMA